MAEMIPDQQGRILLLTPAAPVAGADIVIAMPAGVRWRLKSFQAELTVDAIVATRVVELIIVVTGYELLRITTTRAQNASLTYVHAWHEGEAAQAVSGQLCRVGSLPKSYLINNSAVISTDTVNLQAGDQWDKVVMVVEEWIEPMS